MEFENFVLAARIVNTPTFVVGLKFYQGDADHYLYEEFHLRTEDELHEFVTVAEVAGKHISDSGSSLSFLEIAEKVPDFLRLFYMSDEEAQEHCGFPDAAGALADGWGEIAWPSQEDEHGIAAAYDGVDYIKYRDESGVEHLLKAKDSAAAAKFYYYK